jgi:excinuclease ABC subunit A
MRLKNLGNTVLVVEHDEETMLAADHLLELGPGAGEHGGYVVAQGTVEEFMKASSSTADYLSGRREIEIPKVRRQPKVPEKPVVLKTEKVMKKTATNRKSKTSVA